MKLLTLIALFFMGVTFNSCGKAKYGFTGKKSEPKEQNQNFTEEVPQGNITPNEYRGTDGFWIKGTPGTVNLGEVVTFTGSCGNDKSGQLSWRLGDGKEGKGTELNHTYAKDGTYKIEGVCSYSDGHTQTGTITITVLPKKVIGNQNGGTQQPNQTPSQNGCGCECSNYYYCG